MGADIQDFPELEACAELWCSAAAQDVPLPVAKGSKTKHLPSVAFDQGGEILLIPEMRS